MWPRYRGSPVNGVSGALYVSAGDTGIWGVVVVLWMSTSREGPFVQVCVHACMRMSAVCVCVCTNVGIVFVYARVCLSVCASSSMHRWFTFVYNPASLCTLQA